MTRNGSNGRVRGVLTDVDGTLVDSNDAHARAWVEALAEFGYAVPEREVRRMIGMGGDRVLPRAVGVDAGSRLGKDIQSRLQEIFLERELPHVRALPGARQLLLRLQDEGWKVAVATSAKPDELRPLLEIARVEDLLDTGASAEDASSSKPDPDVVQAALERLGCPPGDAVLLGDTPYDVEAARRAGVRAVALRCGGWDSPELDGAVGIYDDPADLLAKYEASPFG